MTQLPDTITVQNVTVQNVLALTRYLSNEDRRWLGALLSRLDNAPLPEQATLDEAVAFYLADACSLGRAAELAPVLQAVVTQQISVIALLPHEANRYKLIRLG